jgi:hypothetical protein
MKNKSKIYYILLVSLLILPRLALLQNGLDAQRIWDTNTPDAFRFVDSVRNGSIINFLAEDHKYPLLGSYFHVPVIGGYYVINKIFGVYDSAEDFVNTYALNDTNLFFWIRLAMLLVNLVAIWGLWRVVTTPDPSASRTSPDPSFARRGVYLLVLTCVSFYLTIFSVTPRIHSFAFAATVLVMWASFRLVREKSLKNYLLAWGAVGVALSVSQSGITTIVFPVLAHLSSDFGLRTSDFRLRNWFSKKCWLGFGLFLLITLFVGYPQLLFSLFSDSSAPVLSGEHGWPGVGLAPFVRLIKDYFFLTIPAVTFLIIAGLIYGYKKKFKLDVYSSIALLHVIVFLVIFGFTTVVNGRFALVILPSLLFVSSGALVSLEKNRIIRYTALFLIVIQAIGVVWLIPLGFRADTREQVSNVLVAKSGPEAAVLSMVDNHWLSLPQAPAAIRTQVVRNIGATDSLIAEKYLAGPRTRYIVDWDGKEDPLEIKLSRPIGAIIVTAGEDFESRKQKLEKAGFLLIESLSNGNDTNHSGYFAWGAVPHKGFVPLSISLLRYNRMGPSLYIFIRKELRI